MKKLIREDLNKFCLIHNLISKEGFVAGKSSTTNLLEYKDNWTTYKHHLPLIFKSFRENAHPQTFLKTQILEYGETFLSPQARY